MDETERATNEHSSRWMTAVTCSALVLFITTGGVLAMRDQLLKQSLEVAQEQAKAREKLAARVDALQGTLDGMASQPQTDTAALQALTTKLTEMSGKLDALGAKVETIEKAASEKKPEPAPAPLAAAPATAPAPAAPLDATLAALKLAALSGKPFTAELTAWLKLHPEAEKNLVPLAELSTSGIPTEAFLSKNLLDVLDSKSPATAVDDASTVGKINTHLKGLVSIKKSSGPDPYAQLRKDALHEDTATLMREVERLRAQDRAPLEAWLAQARARAAAREALAKLELPAGQ